MISSLWRLIEPILEPDGIELVELEFKPEGGRWILRLYIDTPGGVTLDHCQAVSRQVSALLDMEDPIDHPYNLEVSSPGIDRVIRKPQDFCRYSGSPIQVKTRRKLDGRKNFKGTLKGMENAKVILDVAGNRVEISPEDVESARLIIPKGELFRRDSHTVPTQTGD
ncbi:MAG: ribosome maturation factor RimP [Thermodesulfobacteriota bacterium]